MIMNGLYYYKLVSEYPEDVTKNCKLTINEIDHDLKTLKDMDIKSAEFIRESKTLVLTRNNGEKLIVPLTDVTYNLNVETDCSGSGMTITISYDCVDGPKTVVIDNLVTIDTLKEMTGHDILTKVITDGTLKGNGTIDSPLGISGVEKTGMYAPVKGKIDLTNGGSLPEIAKLGTRYVTVEYVNDYGYLYNGYGVNKIIDNISAEGKGWRVPTKADWDALLNSIEPCEYQNHNSARCHVELGKLAGKYLKSECGWLGQPDCECTVTKPMTGCSSEDLISDYTDDSELDGINSPREKDLTPYGVDKYGMTILPSGVVVLDAYGRPQANAFKEQASFWTTTHVHGDIDQDVYVKTFLFNKAGVYQAAECPDPFYGVRLVKDYDGSNFFDSEYIDGVIYKTILFPKTGQIWLASNYAKKEGFVIAGEGESPEVAYVNNGEVLEKRKALFLNEWNGEYWEKKLMNEGDTVVIENSCFDTGADITIDYCWKINDLDEEECETLTFSHDPQRNVEYRVYTTDGCNQDLVNTDDLVVERVLKLILPIIIREKEERISADTEIWDALNQEIEDRMSADTEIWDALNQEIADRMSGDTSLQEAIDQEREERISGDTILDDKIEQEISDRKAADEELWEALENEISRAISAETELRVDLDSEIDRAKAEEQRLDEKIDAETARAEEAEATLDQKIDDETERATQREDEIEEELLEEIERAKDREDEIEGQLIDPSKNPYTLLASVGKDEFNMVLESKDGNEDHFIKIQFDGNFGEI